MCDFVSVCECVCFVTWIACLMVRIMWLGDQGCYAPKAIMESWNPRAPKICIERIILSHRWLV